MYFKIIYLIIFRDIICSFKQFPIMLLFYPFYSFSNQCIAYNAVERTHENEDSLDILEDEFKLILFTTDTKL